jgi:hypothetical protein
MAAAAIIAAKTAGGGAASMLTGAFLRRRNRSKFQPQIEKEKEVDNGYRDNRIETESRFASGLAAGAQGISGQGEGVHKAA